MPEVHNAVYLSFLVALQCKEKVNPEKMELEKKMTVV